MACLKLKKEVCWIIFVWTIAAALLGGIVATLSVSGIESGMDDKSGELVKRLIQGTTISATVGCFFSTVYATYITCRTEESKLKAKASPIKILGGNLNQENGIQEEYQRLCTEYETSRLSKQSDHDRMVEAIAEGKEKNARASASVVIKWGAVIGLSVLGLFIAFACWQSCGSDGIAMVMLYPITIGLSLAVFTWCRWEKHLWILDREKDDTFDTPGLKEIRTVKEEFEETFALEEKRNRVFNRLRQRREDDHQEQENQVGAGHNMMRPHQQKLKPLQLEDSENKVILEEDSARSSRHSDSERRRMIPRPKSRKSTWRECGAKEFRDFKDNEKGYDYQAMAECNDELQCMRPSDWEKFNVQTDSGEGLATRLEKYHRVLEGASEEVKFKN